MRSEAGLDHGSPDLQHGKCECLLLLVSIAVNAGFLKVSVFKRGKFTQKTSLEPVGAAKTQQWVSPVCSSF